MEVEERYAASPHYDLKSIFAVFASLFAVICLNLRLYGNFIGLQKAQATVYFSKFY